MTLGEVLKQRRAQLQLSQPALAERANIEQSYLSKLENDRSLPSNDIYRRLLNALEMSQSELLDHLDPTYIQNRLCQIEDINQAFQRTSLRQQKSQRRLVFGSALCLALSLPVFYTGYMATLFTAERFEYESPGIVLPGESTNIFFNWPEQFSVVDTDARDEMRHLIYERRDEHRITTFKDRGHFYVEHLPNDFRRTYRQVRSTKIQRPINALLQALGLLLAGLGVIGFMMERLLFKKHR